MSTISATELMAMMARGDAHIIDVREPGEFESGHLAGARSVPVSLLSGTELAVPDAKTLVLVCASGRRSASGCDIVATRLGSDVRTLEGGINAWRAAGGEVVGHTRNVLSIDRQVQVVAGLLVLSGVVFGFSLHPAFFGVSGFVGAGLTFAGLSGFCGMARILALAPWNQARSSAQSA
ncbi:MAG: rhodanese-like domain-containing protein [Bosea sp. (in: a-proteobacteria)]